jgi:hypothetical protein
MPLKISSTGKLLLTQGGRLKTCECCDPDPERTFFRVLDCCAACNFIFVPSEFFDSLGGEWNGTIKVNGRCWSNVEAIERTRDQIETMFPGAVIITETAGIDVTPDDCTTARANLFCPPCRSCCTRGFVGRKCYSGSGPFNPDFNSVCCNWGRQYVVSYVVTRYNATFEFEQPFEVFFESCATQAGAGLVVTEDVTKAGACRVRRNGVGTDCENDCTRDRIFAYCQGVGCAPGEENYVNCAGVDGFASNAPCEGPVLPGEAVCPSSQECDEFEATTTTACNAFCQECTSGTFNSEYSCIQNCFGGRRFFEARSREYHCIWCALEPPASCPETFPGYCSCREKFQCKLSRTATSVFIAEWEVSVESTEGCEIDPCFDYNGGSNCPPGVTTPEEQCMHAGGCEGSVIPDPTLPEPIDPKTTYSFWPPDDAFGPPPPPPPAPPAPGSAWSFM